MAKTKVFVAGHNGMVGSAIVRLLSNQDQINLITKSHKELDLINQIEVKNFLKKKKKLTKYI